MLPVWVRLRLSRDDSQPTNLRIDQAPDRKQLVTEPVLDRRRDKFRSRAERRHAIFDRLAAFRGVSALRIRTSKPDIYPDAHGVGVEIASFQGLWPDT